MDLNGDGKINNGSELFGNFTKLSNGSTAPDGYAALAQYDTNGDNIIDSKDSAFSSLKLWKDVNSDGITQSGELTSLQLSSITAIYLYREDGSSFKQITEAGNIITNQTNFTSKDGTGIVRDVWFKTDATDTITNNETYISTEANESFSGGEGNDTYIVKLGGGKDIIDDNDLSGLGTDTLKFGNGISVNQVLVKWDMKTNGLLIGIRENSDDDTALKDLDNQILIKNWFDGKGKIEEFIFADGTTLNAEDIYNKLVVVKQNGELTARVLNDGDTLIGGRYNDVLFGSSGNELIEGNDGDDYLHGQEGDDKLIGGSDDDTLEGGKGVDILEGGSGDDYYIFGRGDGKDSILDSSGSDTIMFGANIVRQDILAKIVGDDIIFALKEKGKSFEELSDTITIKNYAQTGFEIEKVLFDDGSTYSVEGLLNQAPILVSDIENIEMQDLRTLTQSFKVTDPDGDTLNYTLKTKPTNGTLTLNANGSWSYKATGTFIGVDSAIVQISDGNGGVVNQTLNFDMKVTAPTLDNVTSTLNEDTNITDTLQVNNPVGGTLIYEIVENTDNGNFNLNTDGSYSYTPNENYNGSDEVRVKVTNEYGLSTTVTLDLTITPVNDAPEVSEDTINLTLQDIRSTDGQLDSTDIDGDTLSYTVSTQSEHGTVSINENGKWTYEVAGTYIGTDLAIITVADGNGGTVTQTLNFDNKVTAPTLADGINTILEDNTSNGVFNVINPIGGTLTYEVITTTSNGAFTLNTDGSYNYNPLENYNGEDEVTIKVTNEYGLSTTSKLTFDIEAVNDLPELTQDTVNLTLQDVRTTDGQIDASDVDADTLSYTLKTKPTNGTLTLNANGSWSYKATGTFIGVDSAIVQISDGNGGVVNQTLNFDMKVTAPTLDNVTSTLNEDTNITDTLQVNNPVGGTLIYEIVENTDNGNFNLNTDGSYSYTPNENYNGSDEVRVKVTNEYGLSTTVTLDLTITPVNDAPELTDSSDESHILKNTRIVTGSLEATDIDGDTLKYTIATNPIHGTLSIDENGNWSYESEFGYVGDDHVVLSVNDGNGGSITKEYNFTSKGLIYEGGDLTINEQNIGNTLELGNTNMDSLSFSKSNDDLLIKVKDQGTITLSDYFTTPEQNLTTLNTSWGEININKEVIKEASGSWWNWRKEARANEGEDTLLIGTNSRNKLVGSTGDDILFGYSINDNLYGGDGKDTLFGGDGYDSLYGQKGDDRLFGGTNWDRLFGGEGNDQLIGGSGNDELYGNEGNDTLSGGIGSDWLQGGTGDDTYYVNSGDGHDNINDMEFNFWSFSFAEGGDDTLKFGVDVQKEDISFIMNDGNLLIKYGDGDTIKIHGQSNDKQAIEKFELSDGSFITSDNIENIIQEMSAYATDKGIDMSSQDNIRNNEALMQIVTSGWQSA